MTLQEAVEQFLRNQSKRLASNSIQCYATVLRKLVLKLGAEKDFNSIIEPEIDDFQLVLKANHGTNTQLNYANVLRSFFKFWANRGVAPVIHGAIQGPRKVETLPNFITKEQFEMIDGCFQEDDYLQLTQKLVFNLLWDTGMRIGELVALNVTDIDMGRHHVIITTEKSRKLRVLVWSMATHKLLIKYLGIRLCLNQTAPLFLSIGHGSRRGRLVARTVQRWCKTLQVKLGFPINPHAFRHGKMHAVINAGGGRQHVQVIAGHSSIQSSEVYVRLNEAEQLRIQEQFLQDRSQETMQESPYTQALLAQ